MEIGPPVQFPNGSGSDPLLAGAHSQSPDPPAFQPRMPISKEFFCLDRQERVAEALAHYSEVLRLNPGNTGAHNNIGALFHQQGRIGEAVRHYRKAVHRRPDYANARQNLGNALASQSKVTEAIAHYAVALEISPTNETIRTALEALKGRP